MSDSLGTPSANAPKLVKDPDDTDGNNRMKRFAALHGPPPQEVTNLERKIEMMKKDPMSFPCY